MTSTDSLNKSRFLPVFKSVFKRNIGLFIAVQALSAVLAYLFSKIPLINTEELLLMLEQGYTETTDITATCITIFPIFLFITGILWSLLLAVTLFRELYSKRASTFYFSMPVKREVYYNVNMLFGIITFAVSCAILIAVPLGAVSINEAYQKGILTFDMPLFSEKMVIAAMCVIVIFAIFIMCAVLAGRKWHYFVLALLATDVFNIAITGFIGYLNTIYGLLIEDSPEWMISPSGVFGAAIGSEESSLKYVIALIIQFAVIYAAGYIVFKNRRAEVAEMSLAGRLVPAILITISLLAVSFTSLASNDKPSLVNLAIAIGVAALVAMLLTAIFYKKAFTKKTLICLIVAGVITVIVFAAVEFLPNNRYKYYVPEASEVESVVLDDTVDYTGSSGVSDLITSMFSFSGLDWDWDFDYGRAYTFTSDEAKALVEQFHKKVVAESTIDNAYSDDFYYHGYYSFKLTYKLKNGKTVTRYYDVGTMDVYDEYLALMQTEEALKQSAPFCYLDKDIQYFYVEEYDSDDWADGIFIGDLYSDNFYTSLDEYQTLFDAIIKDKMAEDKDTFYNLYTSSIFWVYDPDDLYRDEDPLDWLLDDDFSDDYYEDEDLYYPDYTDITICFTVLNDNATKEQKALIANMTPEEKANYEESWYIFNDVYVSINREADVNTVAYLEALGLIS